MGQSSCVSCGECMAACPTGALTDKPLTLPLLADGDHKQVDSLCPYCGVGCSITYTVDTKANTIVQVSGRASPVNHGRLCVKGRYGFDYVHHGERLLVPLIRKPEYYPKLPRTARRPAPGVPRSDLGRGPRPGGAAFHGHPRGARQPGTGRLRLRQVLERGQLPVPEAHPRRLRHQQRRSLHAAVPRLVGGRAARPDRRRLGVEPVFRRPGHRRHLHHRLQHHAQPPGGGDVHQAGRQRRRHAARRRPAAARDRRPRRPLRALQPRHRRGVPQRPHARHHPRGAVRRRVHRGAHRGLRPPARHGDRLHAAPGVAPHRGAGAEGDRRRPRLRAGQARHDLLGHGHLAAHHRHRQRPLPHQPGAAHRQHRAARHRPAPAARPEQRAGRLGRRPHSHGVHRLPERRGRRGAAEIRGRCGASGSTRSRA